MSCPDARIAHPSPLPRRPRTRRGRKDAAVVLAESETEAGFRHWLQDLLTLTGWLWVYFPDSRQVQGYPGFVDIFAVRDERALVIETKTQHGKMRRDQIHWAAALLASGRVEYFLWRPDDRAKIEQALR